MESFLYHNEEWITMSQNKMKTNKNPEDKSS
jgi:hypothetical protein